MLNNLVPVNITFDGAAVVRGMQHETPDEANIQVRGVLVVGAVEDDPTRLFVVVSAQHSTTSRAFAYPVEIYEDALRLLEKAGAE